ncbi:hypothetical protein [Tropicibacter alexandrii]|uniref:hypothetical protein n=1 Tax=Tropicibacter alexandrii TaxID=2267683 RepID=UPI0013E8E491|nr:hypothetical protein [Tropicibacter alexandrii]
MTRFFVAALFSLSASAALANVPAMTLPDLTFPTPSPDISTQGCAPVQGQTACQ